MNTAVDPRFHGKLLVCDKAAFLEDVRAIRLGHVVNALEAPVLPYAFQCSFFVKLLYLPMTRTVDYHIELIDAEGEFLAAPPPVAVRNSRGADQIPGADTFADITFVACEPGNVTAQLVVDGVVVDRYPITIRTAPNRRAPDGEGDDER